MFLKSSMTYKNKFENVLDLMKFSNINSLQYKFMTYLILFILEAVNIGKLHKIK
jgi:hypothetical protein